MLRRGSVFFEAYTEVMLTDTRVDDDDELTEGDRQAIAASREYFRQCGDGISFEQVVADCGLTMDQIREPQNNR